MDARIMFRCPQTGAEVAAILQEPKDDSRFETVTCPACTRHHFVHALTGALIPPTLLGPANWTP